MNDERKKQIKNKVTQLLGDKANTNLIDFSVDRVIQSVANFTNIPVDELPPEIDSTITAMCLQLIQTHFMLRYRNLTQLLMTLSVI